ncbi:L-rhamnose-binding lectin CSL3-like [Aethina tumida]|uniref:L-rhamnose-binding lectin CSL3-like n=1 Tax=Aethina tumida TaxID=116153 RepID=UPI0021495508|nr:L-rhamnose-binding lectin CSL3-like [Aethina tumida]
MKQSFTVLILLVLFAISFAADIKTDPLCWHDKLALKCGPGKVIHIIDTYYGTNPQQSCPGYTTGNCYSNTSTAAVQFRCEGANACAFAIEPVEIGGDPCYQRNKDFTVTYRCIESPGTLAETIRACVNETLEIACGPDALISVASAFYGRSDSTTCPSTSSTVNGVCLSGTALNTIKSKCDGKGKCSIRSSPAVLGNPCSSATEYLILKYYCVVKPDNCSL